ncbi:hypothetical protein EKO27_g4033 [Xylaria grammica]|uniref:Uncharacterized protein n=1 Tax=Xylaria grammica TaxID=363999 RepID=A0A439D9I0_9PEZI|nr:hypothetical protein EKO27_g4033 [Xylaria grammica]
MATRPSTHTEQGAKISPSLINPVNHPRSNEPTPDMSRASDQGQPSSATRHNGTGQDEQSIDTKSNVSNDIPGDEVPTLSQADIQKAKLQQGSNNIVDDYGRFQYNNATRNSIVNYELNSIIEQPGLFPPESDHPALRVEAEAGRFKLYERRRGAGEESPEIIDLTEYGPPTRAEAGPSEETRLWQQSSSASHNKNSRRADAMPNRIRQNQILPN